jgi:hypothetical protein
MFGRQVGDGECEGTQAVEPDDPASIVDGDEKPLALFWLPLSQPDPWATAVLVDEFDVRSSQSIFEKLREPKLILGANQTAALLAGCLSRSERSDFNVAQLRRGSRKPPVEAHHRVTPFRLRQVKSIGEIHAPNRPVQGLSVRPGTS